MKNSTSSLSVTNIAHSIFDAFTRDLDHMPVKQLYAGGHSFDIQEYAKQSFLKKFKDDNSDLRAAAEADFSGRISAACNEDLFALTRGDAPIFIKRARNLIDSILHSLTQEEWFESCRNSTGTTIGTRFTDTSWEAKFQYPITGTADAIRLFEIYLLWDPQLDAVITKLNRFSTEPKYKVVEGSRFDTVPKDNSKDRVIAIEPTLNMFFQQGLMFLLVERLAQAGLSLDKLPKTHQLRAMAASVSLADATLDLKNASDSVLTILVKLLFPPMWFGAINLVRSPKMLMSNGEYLDLPIISTMGNATTFPVETLIFYAIAVCAVEAIDIHHTRTTQIVSYASRSAVSVFGDDVILPTRAATLCIWYFSLCGFEVNVEKSHSGAYPFRESCGGDYFAGYDVRPFFLKRPNNEKAATIEAWLYTAFDGLSEVYFKYFGPSYVYTETCLSLILRYIDGLSSIKIVPDNLPADAGIRDPDPRLTLLHVPLVRFSALTLDDHGLIGYMCLQHQFPGRKRNELSMAYYKAVRNPRPAPRWRKLRKNGYWTSKFSHGTMALTESLPKLDGNLVVLVNGLPLSECFPAPGILNWLFSR